MLTYTTATIRPALWLYSSGANRFGAKRVTPSLPQTETSTETETSTITFFAPLQAPNTLPLAVSHSETETATIRKVSDFRHLGFI